MSVIHIRSNRPWNPVRAAKQDGEVTVRYDEVRMVEWRMRLWRDAMKENGNRITAKRERDMLAEISGEVAAFIAAEYAKQVSS